MVSVVIPTKDDEKVFKTIQEVKKQEPEEIIVVDNINSSSEYQEELSSVEGVEYCTVEGKAAAGRNKGARKASEEKILFIDSDCYPTEGWKEKMSEALDEVDIAEGEIEYEGERCPFARLVENRGEEGRFLTANLGITQDVFDEVQFDEKYEVFREDTDFGLRALDKGFESEFVEGKVMHDAGRRTPRKFIQDQERYRIDPYFYNKFRENPGIGEHVNKIGPMYYPKELLFEAFILTSLVLTLFNPLAITGVGLAAVALSSYHTFTAMTRKDAKFCLKDWITGLAVIPVGIFAKRFSIWRGCLRTKTLAI